MAMSNGGLTKLVEECGELVQVAAKLIAYPDGKHPDSRGDLNERLEEEIADVMAACRFVIRKHGLAPDQIHMRIGHKLVVYGTWDREPS